MLPASTGEEVATVFACVEEVGVEVTGADVSIALVLVFVETLRVGIWRNLGDGIIPRFGL
jgi:copper chaperone CopZ